MTLKTVPVTGTLWNADGSVAVGATVAAQLTTVDTDGGVVVPSTVSTSSASDGTFTLNLWPNARGVNGSQYRVRAQMPGALPGVLLANLVITVPDSDPAVPVPIEIITNRTLPSALSDSKAAMLAAQGFALQGQQAAASAAQSAVDATIVSGISGAVNTVAGIATQVAAAGTAATSIVAVAGGLTNINAVAADLTNINAVGLDITALNAVAADLTNINAVAADAANIDSLAGDLANVNAVAGDLANINAVGQDIANIDAAAQHLADIQAAPAAATSAAGSAAAAASSAAFAAASGHIYASTAAAIADGTLANNAYFLVVTNGANFAPLYQKVSGAAVDQNFPFPSALAMQLSTKAVPNTSTIYGELDSFGMFHQRLDSAGVRRIGSAWFERFIQGVAAERFTEVLSVAMRKARSRGQMKWPWDVVIVLKSGQSNSEGAFAVPPVSTTGVPGIMMMDAIRGRFFAGTRYLNGLTPAIEVTDTDGTFNFGETGLRKACEMIQNLVELENGSPYRSHGKILVPLSIGHSSSDVTAFDYGTADFTLAINTLNAIKAWCVARNLSVGIGGGLWAWGANGYQAGITIAQWKSKMLTYFANVDTYLGSIFGQPAQSIPWGLEQTNAHVAQGATPYGAEAEAELVESNTWIDIINPEGPQFLEVSSAHHSTREEAILGGQGGVWFHRRCLMKEKWDSLIPTLSRLDANTVRLTVSLFPGHMWTVKETGLQTTRRMQALYATMLYDQAAPLVALAQSRQPRITNDYANNLAYIDIFATNPLPTLCGFRYSGGSTYGNFVMVPKPQLTEYANTLLSNGVNEPIERWLPIVDRAVP